MNLKDQEKLFKSLANKRRLAIVALLCAKKSATVGEIATKLKLSFKATSKHLLILLNVEILDREQRNLSVSYFLSFNLPKQIIPIISFISNSRE